MLPFLFNDLCYFGVRYRWSRSRFVASLCLFRWLCKFSSCFPLPSFLPFLDIQYISIVKYIRLKILNGRLRVVSFHLNIFVIFAILFAVFLYFLVYKLYLYVILIKLLRVVQCTKCYCTVSNLSENFIHTQCCRCSDRNVHFFIDNLDDGTLFQNIAHFETFSRNIRQCAEMIWGSSLHALSKFTTS